MNQDDDGYYVSCCKEGCVVMTNSYTEKEAAKVWNTRKPMERIVERLEEEANINRNLANEYALEKCDSKMAGIHLVRQHCFEDATSIVKEEGGME